MSSALRRLSQMSRHLVRGNAGRGLASRAISPSSVSIGDVTVPLRPPPILAAVPGAPTAIDMAADQIILEHLQWMMKKDLIGQDLFLVGPPGPLKRQLALAYCHLTQRSVEYITLHRDISGDADMKQRREVQKTPVERVVWTDGPAVRAATLGGVLILDGVEKAERNVLPVLNNLLENREMTLDDGRVLVHPARSDALREAGVRVDHLVPTSEHFRVIALGSPVPKFKGSPLDPPFRSRFAARYVDGEVNGYWGPVAVKAAAEGTDLRRALDLIDTVQFAHLGADAADLPRFPQTAKSALARLVQTCPADHVAEHLRLVYPAFALNRAQRDALGLLLTKNAIVPPSSAKPPAVSVTHDVGALTASVQIGKSGPTTTVPAGAHSPPTRADAPVILTPRMQRAQADLLKAHSLGDVLVVGSRGSGKSRLVAHVASRLGYAHGRAFYVYRDMHARDLLQRRATDNDGNTTWEDSSLVAAAITGDLCILDGVEALDPGALASLARLVLDRDTVLPDGSRLVARTEADRLAGENGGVLPDGIRVIHPSFRVVAVATVPSAALSDDEGAASVKKADLAWFSDDVREMFRCVTLPDPSPAEQAEIVRRVAKCDAKRATMLCNVAAEFRNHDVFKNTLTLRQLIRLARGRGNDASDDIRAELHRVFLTSFVPPFVRRAFDETLNRLGVQPALQRNSDTIPAFPPVPPATAPQDPSLIPHVPSFHLNPQHAQLLASFAYDWAAGEHLLACGTQGTGKNATADWFLAKIGRARQYMQLHRDSTVSSLLVVPVIENGVLVYRDSPLVAAIKLGHVAVIDEADKAPVHVVSILKSLAEAGEMTLTNGVRVVRDAADAGPRDIVMHPDFRLILLANKPGWPFMGNDFIGAIGDVFSWYVNHPVDNLDAASELAVLRKAAPSLAESTLKSLVAAFQELRVAFDEGTVSYPFSLRELLALVRHLDMFPNDSPADALRDVLDFDLHAHELAAVVLPTLARHGLTMPGYSLVDVVAPTSTAAKRQRLEIQKNHGPTSTSAPKHGKVDPNNNPHVGGNTWAGGTGGRDTAGLGGIGGPYRLDAGHDVHQVSDEVKANVPEHIRQAAREMGQDALARRLAEIGMADGEMRAYTDLRNAVAGHVHRLRRVVLALPSNKDDERVWLRHQTDGELDDAKLVDGLAGEHAVFKRRGVADPAAADDRRGKLPKRLRVVFDASASMYRFNGVDGRLTRSLECAVMLMEALAGVDAATLTWDMVAHSGDSPQIPLVDAKNPPRHEKDQFKVLETLVAHSQYCWAGDHTLEATQKAVRELAAEAEMYDTSIVIVISDANLRRYDIAPRSVARALTIGGNDVHAAMVLIGTLGREAEELKRALPPGKAFLAETTQHLPTVLDLRCPNFKSLFDAFGYTSADLPWFLQSTADISQLVHAARIEFPPELNGIVPGDTREDVPFRSRDRVRRSVADADLAKLRESEPAAPPISKIPLWTPTPANQMWEPLAQWAAVHAPINVGDILLHRDPYEPDPAFLANMQRRGDSQSASGCKQAGAKFAEDEFEVEAIIDSMINTKSTDPFQRFKYKIYWRHHGVDKKRPWTPSHLTAPTAPEAVAEFHQLNPGKPQPTPEHMNAWIPWLDEEERQRKAEEDEA
ncbi:hypothetical protein H9P43_003464 [Blastocladiella emersonii ATCC 22665]|nr:hypothetical protein H9P43_003464 [Blastocladiella emersonii ATCC 22665]